jgi:ESCRT-II complex subunit VPS22
MRRGVGVAGVKKRQLEQQQFTELGRDVEAIKIATVRDILTEFRSQLVKFASKHRDKINCDPVFRLQFHNMCKVTGVDPLATSKGLFSDILGIGSYYFDLGVVILDICWRTRSQNGGIISIVDLMEEIRSSSESHRGVSIPDITRAVEKLGVLGNGFRTVSISNTIMILSVPIELNRDHEDILQAAHVRGFVTESAMVESHGWTAERFRMVINPLVQEGLVWIDDDGGMLSTVLKEKDQNKTKIKQMFIPLLLLKRLNLIQPRHSCSHAHRRNDFVLLHIDATSKQLMAPALWIHLSHILHKPA